MQTATKQNTAFVQFSDGQRHKFKTTETIPQIQEKFKLGKGFYLKDGITQIRVENLTIY